MAKSVPTLVTRNECYVDKGADLIKKNLIEKLTSPTKNYRECGEISEESSPH